MVYSSYRHELHGRTDDNNEWTHTCERWRERYEERRPVVSFSDENLGKWKYTFLWQPTCSVSCTRTHFPSLDKSRVRLHKQGFSQQTHSVTWRGKYFLLLGQETCDARNISSNENPAVQSNCMVYSSYGHGLHGRIDDNNWMNTHTCECWRERYEEKRAVVSFSDEEFGQVKIYFSLATDLFSFMHQEIFSFTESTRDVSIYVNQESISCLRQQTCLVTWTRIFVFVFLFLFLCLVFVFFF